MAEQKTEDKKPLVAHRGARPFVAPAGGAAPARPLLRPAASPARPGRAPFAPPLAPGRPALGVAAKPSAAPMPESSSPEPIAAAAAPAIEVAAVEPAVPIDAEPVSTSSLDDLDFEFAAPNLEADVTLQASLDSHDAQDAPRRPVTSEMIAIDAFAAFDSVWGPGNTPAAIPAIEAPVAEAPAPALDAESLGAAAQVEATWADDIAAGGIHEETAGVETSVDPDADSRWARAATPNSALPAWLMDESSVAAQAADVAVDQPIAADLAAPAYPPEIAHADAPVADYAPYFPERDGVDSAVVDAPATAPYGRQTDARYLHGLRVSAALDRLAERIRGGEIDVSSVAPEAPDAAVLASVLAALLGGSSSR